MNFSQIPRAGRLVVTLFSISLADAFTASIHAATTTLWSYDIKFDAVHGFESVPTPVATEGRPGTANPAGGTFTGENSKNYDIIQPNGAGGYNAGSDGVSDMNVTTRVIGSDSGWSRLAARIDSNNGLGANAAMNSGTSKPNDWGAVAYTVTFSSALNLTAKDLAIRLSNVNGDGEVYEWAMVTLGKAEDAPFATLDGSGKLATTIGTYKSTDYSNFTNSSFYNADGSIRANGTATTNTLPLNKTLTQVLAGQPVGSGDYLNPDGSLNNRGTHTVQGGWVALDNFMTKIYDAPPSDTVTAPPVNPRNYDTNFEDEVDITGQSLGLNDLEPLTSFTVWLGYTDVGTAQANGFSKTNADMLGYISNIKIGSSVFVNIPEPGITTLSLAAVAGAMLRRKRKSGAA